jgi:hypothetical protein
MTDLALPLVVVLGSERVMELNPFVVLYLSDSTHLTMIERN